MDQELELLRQRVEFLEQCVFQCQQQIAALQAEVAELRRRPVAVPLEHEEKAELGLQVRLAGRSDAAPGKGSPVEEETFGFPTGPIPSKRRR